MEKMTGRLLALDYGSRRIGLAVSDPLGITAQPLPAVTREGDARDIEKIAAVAREREIDGVIIGLPLLPDGNEGEQARRVRRFAEKLAVRLALPVRTWDERMTTVQAERHLIASGVRREGRREVRDSLSALILLQSALDFRNRK